MQLFDRRVPSLANHRTKRVLQPGILGFQSRQHHVFLALEVLIERCLTDADVGQHLIDADISKAVTIEPTNRRFHEALASGCRHEAFPGNSTRLTTSQPASVPQVNWPSLRGRRYFTTNSNEVSSAAYERFRS